VHGLWQIPSSHPDPFTSLKPFSGCAEIETCDVGGFEFEVFVIWAEVAFFKGKRVQRNFSMASNLTRYLMDPSIIQTFVGPFLFAAVGLATFRFSFWSIDFGFG
jgi:hypothetical protein